MLRALNQVSLRDLMSAFKAVVLTDADRALLIALGSPSARASVQ